MSDDGLGILGLVLLVLGMALWLEVKRRNAHEDNDPG